MNPRNFDELTKTLATSTSRRQALKTLFASAVAGVFGLGQIDAVLAEPERRCHPDGEHCRRDRDCCSRNCRRGRCRKCRPDGDSCKFDFQCCSGLCPDGSCQKPAPTPLPTPTHTPMRCHTVGEFCQRDADCCSGPCRFGRCERCHSEGEFCQRDADCCSGLCRFGATGSGVFTKLCVH